MRRIKKAFHHSKDDSVDSFKRFASTSYEGQTFLHGHLNIEVKSASDLPDLESFISKLVDKKDVSDPYVDVKLGSARLVKTRYGLIVS